MIWSNNNKIYVSYFVFLWWIRTREKKTQDKAQNGNYSGAVQPNKYSINDLCIMRLWRGWLELEKKVISNWKQTTHFVQMHFRCPWIELVYFVVYIYHHFNNIPSSFDGRDEMCAPRPFHQHEKKENKTNSCHIFIYVIKCPTSEWQSQAEA